MGAPRAVWLITYWLLFFLICFGLGYPVLNRIDTSTAAGCFDSREYTRMVPADGEAVIDNQLRARVLVPWVARPFYRLANGRVGSWNPVAFGLLVAGALFAASGALILFSFARTFAVAPQVALAGSLLYLLNFAVPNKQLGCSLVDSGEASLMLALFGALFYGRFYLLPGIGIAGALAKETFIPIAAAAALGWALAEWRQGRWKVRQTLWSGGMLLAGVATFVVLQSSVYGYLVWPWQFAAQQRVEETGLLAGLAGVIADRQFWYVFAWLLPLGAIRLMQLPGKWVYASLAGAGAALAMGAWNNAGGTAAYAVFHAIGPALSLSAAQLLASGAGNISGRASVGPITSHCPDESRESVPEVRE